MASGNDILLQADKSAFKAKKIGGGKTAVKGNGIKKEGMNLDSIDFNKKILHGSWHPRENTIAVRQLASLPDDECLTTFLVILDRCNQ